MEAHASEHDSLSVLRRNGEEKPLSVLEMNWPYRIDKRLVTLMNMIVSGCLHATMGTTGSVVREHPHSNK